MFAGGEAENARLSGIGSGKRSAAVMYKRGSVSIIAAAARNATPLLTRDSLPSIALGFIFGLLSGFFSRGSVFESFIFGFLFSALSALFSSSSFLTVSGSSAVTALIFEGLSFFAEIFRVPSPS